MPRRRACTTASLAYGLAIVATAPTCSHALVAPRHSMMSSARAPIGRRRHRWAPALRRRGGGDDDDEDDDEDEEDEDEEEDEDDEDYQDSKLPAWQTNQAPVIEIEILLVVGIR